MTSGGAVVLRRLKKRYMYKTPKLPNRKKTNINITHRAGNLKSSVTGTDLFAFGFID